MTIAISEAVAAKDGNHGPHLRVKSVDVAALGPLASPICLFDDFRVSGTPFGPHPHAGFSQITNVFPDSPGGNRSRDSLGNDIVVGPGGIVWMQAGSGMLHQEMPADSSRELHGLQVFVNLSQRASASPLASCTHRQRAFQSGRTQTATPFASLSDRSARCRRHSPQ